MNDDLKLKEIQSKVLARVQSGNVRMRSRAYFLVRVIATGVVAFFALSTSAFILSFIMFSIHASGQQLLLGFGFQGILTFFLLFPWFHLALDLLLVLLLEWLVQGFRFGYRFSFVSLFVWVFIASAALGFLIGITPLHTMLLDEADQGRPPLGGMYEHIRDPHHDLGIFRGTVIAAQNNVVVVDHYDGDHDPDDGSWTVRIPADTPLPQKGDRVYIYGTSTSDHVIDAYGIQPLSPEQ